MESRIDELERIADKDENATSMAWWWRERSKALGKTIAAPIDMEAAKVSDARQEMMHCAAIYARGVRNGQLAITFGRAYITWAGITARRPELITADDEQWEMLFAEI